MQMFCRDPSGNLVKIARRPGDEIDADILTDSDYVDIDGDNPLFASGRNEHRRGNAD